VPDQAMPAALSSVTTIWRLCSRRNQPGQINRVSVN